jgi:hypothetical protein
MQGLGCRIIARQHEPVRPQPGKQRLARGVGADRQQPHRDRQRITRLDDSRPWHHRRHLRARRRRTRRQERAIEPEPSAVGGIGFELRLADDLLRRRIPGKAAIEARHTEIGSHAVERIIPRQTERPHGAELTHLTPEPRGFRAQHRKQRAEIALEQHRLHLGRRLGRRHRCAVQGQSHRETERIEPLHPRPTNRPVKRQFGAGVAPRREAQRWLGRPAVRRRGRNQSAAVERPPQREEDERPPGRESHRHVPIRANRQHRARRSGGERRRQMRVQ